MTTTEPNQPAPSIQIFTLALANGVRFTAQVNVAALRNLTSPRKAIAFDLEGPRNASDWPKYLAWANDVWQYVADAAHKSIVSIFAPPYGKPFAVVFEPNRPPETVPLP